MSRPAVPHGGPALCGEAPAPSPEGGGQAFKKQETEKKFAKRSKALAEQQRERGRPARPSAGPSPGSPGTELRSPGTECAPPTAASAAPRGSPGHRAAAPGGPERLLGGSEPRAQLGLSRVSPAPLRPRLPRAPATPAGLSPALPARFRSRFSLRAQSEHPAAPSPASHEDPAPGPFPEGAALRSRFPRDPIPDAAGLRFPAAPGPAPGKLPSGRPVRGPWRPSPRVRAGSRSTRRPGARSRSIPLCSRRSQPHRSAGSRPSRAEPVPVRVRVRAAPPGAPSTARPSAATPNAAPPAAAQPRRAGPGGGGRAGTVRGGTGATGREGMGRDGRDAPPCPARGAAAGNPLPATEGPRSSPLVLLCGHRTALVRLPACKHGSAPSLHTRGAASPCSPPNPAGQPPVPSAAPAQL